LCSNHLRSATVGISEKSAGGCGEKFTILPTVADDCCAAFCVASAAEFVLAGKLSFLYLAAHNPHYARAAESRCAAVCTEALRGFGAN